MMKQKFFNGCLVTQDESVVKKAAQEYSGFRLVTKDDALYEAYQGFQWVDKDTASLKDRLYLSSLDLPDNLLDGVIEKVCTGARLMVRCHYDLNEIGKIDTKYRCSPLGLLEKMGILQNALLMGAVYLDKDDARLAGEYGCTLILSPSYEAGSGHGIIHIRPYLQWGMKVEVATYDNTFNTNGSLLYELALCKIFSTATDKDLRAPQARQLIQIGCASSQEPTQEQIAEFEKNLFSF